MTRDRLNLLFQHCADLGLDVDWAPLGDHRRGEYHHDGRRIVLNLNLTRRQVTACLAHEVGHAEFSDTCSTPRNERRAWQYGASLVITPTEYREAELLVGHHLPALAIELEVTPKLVEAWRCWYQRCGCRVDASTSSPPQAPTRNEWDPPFTLGDYS